MARTNCSRIIPYMRREKSHCGRQFKPTTTCNMPNKSNQDFLLRRSPIPATPVAKSAMVAGSGVFTNEP